MTDPTPTPRNQGTNPRAQGQNPRAQGTNPRAQGTRDEYNRLRRDIAEIHTGINRILRHLDANKAQTGNGPRTLSDGTRFLPGTGPLDLDPDRPRSPELQAAIAAWERDHP